MSTQKKRLAKASVPCPRCNGGTIQFDRVQTEIYCQCGYQAPTPPKWQGQDAEDQWVKHLKQIARQHEKSAVLDGLKPHDVEFLIGLAEEINKGFGYLPSYDPFSGHYRSKREYLDLYVEPFLDIGAILQLRDQHSGVGKKRRLPDDSFFAQNVIEQGAPGIATDKQRIVLFGQLVRHALSESLDLKREKGILVQKRNQIILDCVNRGMSHAEIAKELDSVPDLAADQLLVKFGEITMTMNAVTWQDALKNPKLNQRVKTLFSKAGRKTA